MGAPPHMTASRQGEHWPAISRERLMDAAIETTGSVVLALHPDHTIFFWNRAAELLYGVSRDEAYGQDYVATYIVPEQRDGIAADIRKVLAGEPTFGFEDDSIIADGRRRTLVWNVTRVLDDAGEPCGIVAAGYDITARREAERTLRLVWDQSTEGLLLGGGPGIIDCNPAALAMLGLSDPSELIGRHPSEFSPEFQPDGVPSRDKARLLDAETKLRGELRFEWMHQKRDGTPVPTMVHVRRTTLDGRPMTVVAWHDLSEQRAVAKREADLQARLLRSQKLDALGHLAGGVAHDFNNLLAAIRGSLELAALDVAPGSTAAVELQLAQETTVRAATLVRQLLTFGRQGDSAHAMFDLVFCVRGATQLLQRLLPAHITLHLDLSPTPLYVWGDAGQVEQVVVNLVVNARDAIERDGTITVRVRESFKESVPCAALDVVDTGVGMPVEVQERVFDPFFTTKPVGAGSGLGLAVVYGIVSAHDGTVQVASRSGEGTTVSVALPIADEARVTSVDSDRPISGPIAIDGSTGAEGLILLVDDEPAVRRAMARLLERAGYRVLSATHGAEALTVWHANAATVRAVVSDVRMPVMNGPDLVRQLRATGSRIPVVLMSGFADAELMATLPDGVDRVLAKPFEGRTLLGALRALLTTDDAPREAGEPTEAVVAGSR